MQSTISLPDSQLVLCRLLFGFDFLLRKTDLKNRVKFFDSNQPILDMNLTNDNEYDMSNDNNNSWKFVRYWRRIVDRCLWWPDNFDGWAIHLFSFTLTKHCSNAKKPHPRTCSLFWSLNQRNVCIASTLVYSSHI